MCDNMGYCVNISYRRNINHCSSSDNKENDGENSIRFACYQDYYSVNKDILQYGLFFKYGGLY